MLCTCMKRFWKGDMCKHTLTYFAGTRDWKSGTHARLCQLAAEADESRGQGADGDDKGTTAFGRITCPGTSSSHRRSIYQARRAVKPVTSVMIAQC